MISEAYPVYSEAYVWVWLPEAVEPVVAGVLTQQGQQLATCVAAAPAVLESIRLPSCARGCSDPDSGLKMAWRRKRLLLQLHKRWEI